MSADNLKYGAAYYPYIKTMVNYFYNDADIMLSHWVNGETGIFDGERLSNLAGKEDILFNNIKTELTKLKVTLPPGSAVAGIYVRNDRDRGVWKTPANLSLNSVVMPSKKITNLVQENMNVDKTSGKSVNAIREFPGKGILIWGARTLAGNDNEWRYISVRRFFNMVEESVKKSTEWVYLNLMTQIPGLK